MVIISEFIINSFSYYRNDTMRQIALTADSLSLGDLADRRIRSNMAWSLLPTQAVFSSVLPGEYMEGVFTDQINFPGWLGKNSKTNKRKRLAQEIVDHTRTTTSGSRLAIRLDYAPFLLNAIVGPLKEKGADGVPESLAVIKQYRLLREDIESLIELSTWPKCKSPWDQIDGKVKAALTRAYNKEVGPYTYSAIPGVKKKKGSVVKDEGEEMDGEDEGESAAEEEGDEDDGNAFLKKKKGAAASSSSASTSKDSKKKPAAKKSK